MTSPDIAFIQPPGWAVANPPLGLAMLGGYLAEHMKKAMYIHALNLLDNKIKIIGGKP